MNTQYDIKGHSNFLPFEKRLYKLIVGMLKQMTSCHARFCSNSNNLSFLYFEALRPAFKITTL